MEEKGRSFYDKLVRKIERVKTNVNFYETFSCLPAVLRNVVENRETNVDMQPLTNQGVEEKLWELLK